MTYERIELGDRLAVHLFGTADRGETHQCLALVQNLAMDEDFMWQIDRLRSKVEAMTDAEWEAFYHRTREEVGNLLRALKSCVWSAALSGCANAEFARTDFFDKTVSGDKEKKAEKAENTIDNILGYFRVDSDQPDDDFPEKDLFQ